MSLPKLSAFELLKVYFSNQKDEMISFDKNFNHNSDEINLINLKLFLFENKPNELEFNNAKRLNEFDSSDIEFSLPFQSCAFALISGEPLFEMVMSYDNSITYPVVLIIKEKSPGVNIFLVLGYSYKDGDLNITGAYYDQGKDDSHIEKTFKLFLREIRKNKIASERVNEQIKIRRNGKNTIHKIKTIIHVRQNDNPKQTGVYGGPLDWTHRWEVMGHWRRVKGIGKNREGIYETIGFTWIGNYIKGPENKPLIQKTRIIENRNEA